MAERRELLRLKTVHDIDVVLVDQGSELDLELDFWGNGTKQSAPISVSDANRIADELRAWARRKRMEKRDG